MAGGLLQLIGKGAQDQLVTGNPSFTHFRSVYKRHTEFAMEHFQLPFKTSVLTFPTAGTLKLRTKVERYAQLVHDCYLNIDIPDIYSPVVPVSISGLASPPLNPASKAIGYEFQWVRNLGYNMIRYVSLLINGQEIVRHTGEWMKLYANLTFDANKKAILDRMIGNTPDLYDPANADDRINQYPHAISTSISYPEPSIRGRTLVVPLHFWFCETAGQALPLVSLQNSEVEIVVELRSAYDLFTVKDVRTTNASGASMNFGRRIAPDTGDMTFNLKHFLSPPLYETPNLNTIQYLSSWNFNPFIEANYIFVADTELAYLAKTEQSFLISQVDMVQVEGHYGPSNDLELTMKNLVTRIVWAAQRSDRIAQNDHDNYTNWEDASKSPFTPNAMGWYTTGLVQPDNVNRRDILLESTLILDGKERFAPKDTVFFSGIQPYRHQTGNPIAGIYEYSFALNNDPIQPSGHLNGSMFNRTMLRNTFVSPPYAEEVQNGTANTTICVLKSTATSKNPIVITNPNVLGSDGKPLYKPEDVVTIVQKSASGETYKYRYTVRAYVQSYNFLRILGGLGNVVFSS